MKSHTEYFDDISLKRSGAPESGSQSVLSYDGLGDVSR